MKEFEQLTEKINNSTNILLISHIGPDGDTIGSTLGFYFLIKENFANKNVHFVIQHRIPQVYEFLPDINKAILTNYQVDINQYDLAIAIDCATSERMGYFEKIFFKAKKTANIDHHITNPNFADINIVGSNLSSTGELLYNYATNQNLAISANAATAIYTAILTDTGGYKYSNTTAKALYTGSKLIELGAKPHEIYECCYEKKPMAMQNITAYSILNAKYLANKKIAYIVIDRKLMEQFGALDEHLDGISEALRETDCVDIAFVLKETVKGEAKFSFRSKTIDVAKICQQFGGGGHMLAAGCLLKKSLSEALELVLPKVIEQVEKCWDDFTDLFYPQ